MDGTKACKARGLTNAVDQCRLQYL